MDIESWRTRWGVAKAMRYVAMQVLTWGTIAGAICSALLLAALDTPGLGHMAEWQSASKLPLPAEPTQAGRTRPKPAPDAAASAASAAPVKAH